MWDVVLTSRRLHWLHCWHKNLCEPGQTNVWKKSGKAFWTSFADPIVDKLAKKDKMLFSWTLRNVLWPLIYSKFHADWKCAAGALQEG